MENIFTFIGFFALKANQGFTIQIAETECKSTLGVSKHAAKPSIPRTVRTGTELY